MSNPNHDKDGRFASGNNAGGGNRAVADHIKKQHQEIFTGNDVVNLKTGKSVDIHSIIRSPNLQEKVLDSAHEIEAEKHGAAFHNFGWVTGNNEIVSKTSNGILTTKKVGRTYVHKWE